MSLLINNITMDRFSGFLMKLDNLTKERLISKLTASLKTSPKEDFDLKSLAGAWIDERSSDEIIADIKNSCVEKRENPLFE